MAIAGDLAFADLLMWAPLNGAEQAADFLCVAHARPTTGPTVHPEDVVGTRVAGTEYARLRQALRDGIILRDEQPSWLLGVPVRRELVPVRLGGRQMRSSDGRRTWRCPGCPAHWRSRTWASTQISARCWLMAPSQT